MATPEGSSRPSENEPLPEQERATKAASLLEELRDTLSQVQEFRDAVMDKFGDRSDHPVDQFFSQDPDQRDAFFGSTHSGVEFEKDDFTYFVDYSAKRPLKVSGPVTLIELSDMGIFPGSHESKINVAVILERTKVGANRGENLTVSLTEDSESGIADGIFSYKNEAPGIISNTEFVAKKIGGIFKSLNLGK